MTEVVKIGTEMWRILVESSFYILIGIVIAGLLKVYINQEFILKHMRNGRFRSVFKATLLGIPLPL